MKQISEFRIDPTQEAHAMVTANGFLYVLSKNSVFEYELPVETVWVRIFKLLGIKKYSH